MERFRRAVESGDPAAIAATLAEDVEFLSPVVFRPYRGRAVVGNLLRAAVAVFQDFRYREELRGDRSSALIFEARVGDKQVEGIDLLEVNAEGLVSKLTVFVRPLQATMALADAMRRQLEALSAPLG